MAIRMPSIGRPRMGRAPGTTLGRMPQPAAPNLPEHYNLPPILSDSSFKQFEPGKAKAATDNALALNEKRGMGIGKKLI